MSSTLSKHSELLGFSQETSAITVEIKTAIRGIQSQVEPALSIAPAAQVFLLSIVGKTVARLAGVIMLVSEGLLSKSRLTQFTPRRVTPDKEIPRRHYFCPPGVVSIQLMEMAVSVLCPGQLAKHAISEGTKVNMKFGATAHTRKRHLHEDAGRYGEIPCAYPMSRGQRLETLCCLQMSVGAVRKLFLLQDGIQAMEDVPVLTQPHGVPFSTSKYVAAVAEYVVAEILELSGKLCKDERRVGQGAGMWNMPITVHHIERAIEQDDELKELFHRLQGGVPLRVSVSPGHDGRWCVPKQAAAPPAGSGPEEWFRLKVHGIVAEYCVDCAAEPAAVALFHAALGHPDETNEALAEGQLLAATLKADIERSTAIARALPLGQFSGTRRDPCKLLCFSHVAIGLGIRGVSVSEFSFAYFRSEYEKLFAAVPHPEWTPELADGYSMLRSSVQGMYGFYAAAEHHTATSGVSRGDAVSELWCQAVTISAGMGWAQSLAALLAQWDATKMHPLNCPEKAAFAALVEGVLLLAAQMAALRGQEGTLSQLLCREGAPLPLTLRPKGRETYETSTCGQLIGLDSPLSLAVSSGSVKCVKLALRTDGVHPLYLTDSGWSELEASHEQGHKKQEHVVGYTAMARAALLGDAVALAIMLNASSERLRTASGDRELRQLLYLAVINGHGEAAASVAEFMDSRSRSDWLLTPHVAANPVGCSHSRDLLTTDLLVELHCRSAIGFMAKVANLSAP
eukprot:SAG31_NODE_83_length_27039_cov_14.035746_15_plen_738_part_00